MAAITAIFVSVTGKCFFTKCTLLRVDGSLIHCVRMRVPPSNSAGVAAKFARLMTGILRKKFSTLQTKTITRKPQFLRLHG
ncbi:MAG: hypothetical protein RR709_09625, partial [Ruthenibacterium sp.]